MYFFHIEAIRELLPDFGASLIKKDLRILL